MSARISIRSAACSTRCRPAPGWAPGGDPLTGLGKIVTRCVEPDPELRWQSVAELEHALMRSTARPGAEKMAIASARRCF